MPVNRIIVVITLLIVAFLAGFAPQYVKVQRLERLIFSETGERPGATPRFGRSRFRSSQPEELWARGWNERAVFHPYPRGDGPAAGCERTRGPRRAIVVSGQDRCGTGEGRSASVGRPSGIVEKTRHAAGLINR